MVLRRTEGHTIGFNSKEAVETYSKKPVTKLEKFLFIRFLAGTVLDLGCGTGRTTEYIHGLGYCVYGVDISEPMISQARTQNPDIRYLVGDLADLRGFPSNGYETVVMAFNSLDYVSPYPRRIKALCEVYRVLKPGGYLIYSSHDRKRIPWRRVLNGKLRPASGRYWTEKIAHGTYLTYWGTLHENVEELLAVGFETPLSYPENSWTYYISRKGDLDGK